MSEPALTLLKFPLSNDPILNRIDSLRKHIEEDETGDYADELCVLLINYAANFPAEEYPEMVAFERRLGEARHWLNEAFGEQESELTSITTEDEDEA